MGKTAEEKAVEKAAKEEAKAKAKAEKEAEKAVEKADKTSVVVEWRGNTRTYSKEIHGDDFLELAESFAKKFNGTIK